MNEIKQYVLRLCKDSKNSWWQTHIEKIIEFSKILAKETDADMEIIEISAWLHDIKKIKGERDDHHVYGADEAEELLKRLKYPEDKIKKVKHCILTHSTDKKYPPESIEAQILNNADAMSSLDDFNAFAHWVYKLEKCSISEGKEKLINIFKKKWNKLTMPKAKEISKPKYDAIIFLLEV